MTNLLKNKTNTMLLISLSLFLILLGSFVFSLRSLRQRNFDVATERKELENEVALMRSIQQVRRSVLSSSGEQEELATFFINEDSLPRFLGTLEAIAVQTKVSSSISRVSLSAERNSLSVALRVSGDYQAIHQYLEMVEYAPFRISINRIFLQHTPVPPTAEQPGYSSWSADMEIALLSYSEEHLPDITTTTP